MSESGYYAIIPGWLLTSSSVSDGAKLFYGEVSRRCNERGYCWASNEALASDLRCGTRTVSRYVAELEDAGAITTENVGVSDRKRRHERRIRLAEAARFDVAKNGDLNVAKNGELNVAKNGDVHNRMNNNSMNNPPEPPTGGRPAPEPAKWKPERFEAFWTFYRQNVNSANRSAARKAWDKLKLDDATVDAIALALVTRLRVDDEWRRGIGRPHASTYLNGKMWLDDPGTQTAQTPPAYAPPPQQEEAFGVWH